MDPVLLIGGPLNGREYDAAPPQMVRSLSYPERGPQGYVESFYYLRLSQDGELIMAHESIARGFACPR